MSSNSIAYSLYAQGPQTVYRDIVNKPENTTSKIKELMNTIENVKRVIFGLRIFEVFGFIAFCISLAMNFTFATLIITGSISGICHYVASDLKNKLETLNGLTVAFQRNKENKNDNECKWFLFTASISMFALTMLGYLILPNKPLVEN